MMTQKNVRHQNKLPKYCLDNAKEGTYSFWGDEPTTFLGWYADKEQITKEISEIHNAIVNGTATYVLKYSAKTERKWMKVKIIEQQDKIEKFQFYKSNRNFHPMQNDLKI